MQRGSAAKSLPGLPATLIMIPLKYPAIHARLERAIANQIRAACGNHFDIVDQTFASPLQGDVELISVSPTIVHHAGGFDVDPWALARFVTVGPIGRETP